MLHARSWPRLLRLAGVILLVLPLLGRSSLPPGDRTERVRAFTRHIEFDYVSWTLDALALKFTQVALGAAGYLPAPAQTEAVLDYLDLVREIQEAERNLDQIFSDPAVEDAQAAAAPLLLHMERLQAQIELQEPLAESTLQIQLNSILAEMGLAAGGQAIPPPLYRTSSPPLALIVSPRDVIRQDANLSLNPGLTLDQRAALEGDLDRSLNVSSLTVPTGGIGLYPAMVMQTSDLNWLAEVVAHEWIHNFFTLRPLGLSYFKNQDLRTMNETAATIAGKEIGRALVARFYPHLLPPPPEPVPPEAPPADRPEPPAFDFRAEMRLTRLTVDRLLAEGEIERAEAYMELRRRFFWDHGYRIRKLNQAYFAFFGTYADEPGGPAGDDPVGAAVRALRARSPDLSSFLNRIAWMSSFEQLRRVIDEG